MLIGMLVVTRIKQLGIKGLLTSKEEWFSFQLPFDLSKITVSDSLTITFRQYFSDKASMRHTKLSTFPHGFRLSLPFGFVSCFIKPNSKTPGLSTLQRSTKPKNRCLP